MSQDKDGLPYASLADRPEDSTDIKSMSRMVVDNRARSDCSAQQGVIGDVMRPSHLESGRRTGMLLGVGKGS